MRRDNNTFQTSAGCNAHVFFVLACLINASMQVFVLVFAVGSHRVWSTTAALNYYKLEKWSSFISLSLINIVPISLSRALDSIFMNFSIALNRFAWILVEFSYLPMTIYHFCFSLSLRFTRFLVITMNASISLSFAVRNRCTFVCLVVLHDQAAAYVSGVA